MGRKVHPYGFRLGIIKPWRARWFASGEKYGELLTEDLRVRALVESQVKNAGISDVTIERLENQINVRIKTAKPGIIIGKKGERVNQLRDSLKKLTDARVAKVDVIEVSQPDSDPAIIAQSIASQLERRISHKRAMKLAALRAMKSGAQGIKIAVSGRLAGSDMSRKDQVIMGRVPRQTLRADIDYAQAEALTTYSKIGVKVWIYRGEVLPGDEPLGATDADFAS